MTNLYLETSPIRADGGATVGKLPASIPQHDLRDLGHPESPIRAIRAKCVDCSGGVATEARKCVFTGCALWPYRMGANPFRKPASEAQRASTARATAARMARADVEQRSRRGSIEPQGRPATSPHADDDSATPSVKGGRA